MAVRCPLPLAAGLATVLVLTNAMLGPAHAESCEPPSGVSPCIDANSLWLPAGDAHFLSIAPALPLPEHEFAAGLALSFFDRPIRLRVPSPDPEGRMINLVSDSVDAGVLLSFGAMERLELTAAMPMALYQRGAGVQGITSQSAPPITNTVLRDPRLGAGVSVVEHRPLGFAAKARLELSFPLGAEQQLAGEPSLAGAPSFAMELVRGRVRLGSEIGFRLREVTEIAGTRIGSQASLAFGIGVGVLEASLLSLALEGWMLPSLLSQNRDLADGTRVRDAVLVPAEWQLSARSMPIQRVAFQLGAGTALPLSSERRIAADGASSTEHFAGATAARWRAVLVVRYLPFERE